MRILITGAGGFAGRHLAVYLLAHQPENELHGTTIGAATDVFVTGVQPHPVDLRDETAMTALMDTLRPDQVYHLAGTALVQSSPDAAWETIENNTYSILRLLQACHALPNRPRVLVVTTGEFYERGTVDCANESTPILPANPYAVSKIAQEMLAIQYSAAGLPVIRSRSFNHIGRGQRTGFAIPDFASQIARIEAGLQEPILTCRNTVAERDFTDVRDMVRAYTLLMEHGIAGEAYNIATGRLVPLRTVLDILIANSTYSGRIEIHPSGAQREDRLCGDASKLRTLTGWTPEFSLEQTLRDVLDDWRVRVSAESVGQPK